MDISNAYASWAVRHLPNAMIVYDHFHLIKAMNGRLDQARWRTVRGLDEETRASIKGLRFTFLRNAEDLAPEQKAPLDAAREQFRELSDGAEDVHALMGIEGNASKIFFSAYFRPLGWTRRAPRCKHDPYNVLLDIGYTYLFHFVEALLSLYGFDLFCGVHHTFFYQRKSLVCDIVEPFRCIIDRRVRKAHNLRQINPEDFFFKNNQWNLAYKEQDKYTRLFLKDILEEKQKIFLFCQSYYRWFIRDKPMEQFPVYRIVD